TDAELYTPRGSQGSEDRVPSEAIGAATADYEEGGDRELSEGLHTLSVLPSSSVWCSGETIETSRPLPTLNLSDPLRHNMTGRECRFRNLYYWPSADRWFIIRSNSSVIEGLDSVAPDDRWRVLNVGSPAQHPYTAWTFDEVHPAVPALRGGVRVRVTAEPHFLFKRFHAANIMHVLHDDIIPLFHHLKKHCGPDSDPDSRLPFPLAGHRLLFIDPYGPATLHARPYSYLGRAAPRHLRDFLAFDSGVVTCLREAYVGTSARDNWYQYGFGRPQGPIPGHRASGLRVREVAEWFCDRVGLALGEDEGYRPGSALPAGAAGDPDPPPPVAPPPAPPRRGKTAATSVASAVSASDAPAPSTADPDPDAGSEADDFPETDLVVVLARRGNRLLLNEAEVAAALSVVAGGRHVVTVANEEQAFEAQVALLRRARVVVGVHGSLLGMAMFCRRGTVLVELFPFGVPAESYTPYREMASLPGMDLVYRAWENKNESRSVAHPDNEPLLGGIRHLSPEEQTLIEATKIVPPHQCCDNPFWLYRVYQDTEADVPAVAALAADGLRESRALLRRLRARLRSPTRGGPGDGGGGGGGAFGNGEGDAPVLPPLVHADQFACLDGADRRNGTLWVRWDAAWTGVAVDYWVVRLEEDGRLFSTETNSLAVSGFNPGQRVALAVAGFIDGQTLGFGPSTYCIV
ncbi:Protein O-linked-mannose beta-1,4-N-acetylglucosaminyltransferase 2, partial [Cladochytrium tenue]